MTAAKKKLDVKTLNKWWEYVDKLQLKDYQKSYLATMYPPEYIEAMSSKPIPIDKLPAWTRAKIQEAQSSCSSSNSSSGHQIGHYDSPKTSYGSANDSLTSCLSGGSGQSCVSHVAKPETESTDANGACKPGWIKIGTMIHKLPDIWQAAIDEEITLGEAFKRGLIGLEDLPTELAFIRAIQLGLLKVPSGEVIVIAEPTLRPHNHKFLDI